MRAWIFGLAAVGLWVGTAAAKPPRLSALEPGGARQGTTVLVRASGTFDPGPLRAWCDGKGVSIEAAGPSGRFWVTVAEDAAPGVRWVRLHNDEGASTLRPFLVGSLPELVEVEPNDDPGKAQPVVMPAVTINGKLSRNGDVDGFAVALEKGETLVASMEANRRLGSPMDGLLQVARPDGIVVAENDDDHDRDPQVAFTAPADGVYVVRTFAFPATPDSRIGFSGGEAFVYRLTITTRGFIDHPFPLAVRRDGSSAVRAEGWNLGEAGRTLRLSASAGASTVATGPGLANPAEVLLVDHPTAVEVEPNSLERPQEVVPPISISGRLDSSGDRDVFGFSGRKGDRLVVRVASRSLGQPLDPTLRVLDAAGKAVSEADDSNNNRDAELTLQVPADGAYRVVVRDLNGGAGPRAVYLLTIAPPTPDWKLKLASDTFSVAPGKPVSLTVNVERTNGFDQAIEVATVGLPEGLVSAAPGVSEPKGPSARSVTLKLEAKAATTWSGPFRVVGRVKGAKVERNAEAKVEGFTTPTTDAWLTVLKPAESKPAAK